VRERYAWLGRRTAFVAVYASGLERRPASGVFGQDLAEDEPLRLEWDVAVVAPHFAGIMVAHDLGDEGVPELDRRFEYAVTYDRTLAVRAPGC